MFAIVPYEMQLFYVYERGHEDINLVPRQPHINQDQLFEMRVDHSIHVLALKVVRPDLFEPVACQNKRAEEPDLSGNLKELVPAMQQVLIQVQALTVGNEPG